MYIIIRSFLFISVVAVISGCVSLDITHTPPSSFIDNCNEPQLPLFMIKVDEDPGLGSFASVRVFLLANGKEHQMNRQISDSIWGTYSLYASVDNDGEVRYRYRIESRRTGYTSVSKSYRPNDRWEVAPMGKITWSSPSEIVVPSSVEVFEATYGLFEYHGFNREIHIQKEAIPRNATETAERIITITNGYAYGIMFFNIKILSEMPPSGIEMDEFSITEQDG
ncbi:MAG: hypothetical protein HGJ97_18450, partial [Desulfosporosinus sp.]|nr:hypothetical protein [Desulfosporosinus sp.]